MNGLLDLAQREFALQFGGSELLPNEISKCLVQVPSLNRDEARTEQ